ncbi:MAG: hypothetical protein K2Q26_10695 [Bdellovibrionales bacterium]|nr:hypothetical protein [Bdellovibrionales bacterium]
MDFPFIAWLGEGDNYIQIVAEICKLSHMLSEGSIIGIDHNTMFGASEFFLRPNLITYSPIIFYFAWLLGPLTQLGAITLLYFHMVFFTFIGTYSLVRISRYYLKLSWTASLFLCLNYFLGIAATVAIGIFVTFYFYALLFPIGLWLRLKCYDRNSKLHSFALSLIYLFIYLGGYIPFSLISIMMVELTAIAWSRISPSVENKGNRSNKLFFSPLIFASAIAAPLYLCYYDYAKFVSMYAYYKYGYTALENAWRLKDLASIVGPSIHIKGFPADQLPTWGMGNIVVLILGLVCLPKMHISRMQKKVLTYSFFTYLFFFCVCLGDHTPAARLFFLIPGVGKMHIYQRYLVILSIYFYFFLAILLDQSLKVTDQIRWWSTLLIVSFFCMATTAIIFSNAEQLTWFGLPTLGKEMLTATFGLAVVTISKRKDKAILVYIAVFTVLFLKFHWSFLSDRSNLNLRAKQSLDLSEPFNKKLAEEVRSLGKKDLYRGLNVSRYFHRNLLIANYPWVVQRHLPLADLRGYDQHLSSPIDFKYDKLNTLIVRSDDGPQILDVLNEKLWVAKSHIDFLIIEKGRELPKNDFFDSYSQRVPLNSPLELAIKPTGLDTRCTGLICGQCENIDKKITLDLEKFKSDYISYKYGADCESPTITYQQWPVRRLGFYVNSVNVEPILVDGFYTLKLPRGEGKLEIIYQHKFLLAAVLIIQMAIVALVILILNEFRKKLSGISGGSAVGL